MAELQIIEQSETMTVVALSGELDSPGVNGVEDRFRAAICPSGRNAVVDLSGVTFLASLGMRMLIAAARTLAARGARLVMHSPQELVRESLVGAALDDFIPLADDADGARRLLDA